MGDVDVKGLEIEAVVDATDNLQLWTAIGLTDEDISSATLATLAPGAAKGRLPGLPRRTMRLGVDYRRSLTSDWDLLASVDLDYASGYYSTIQNVLEIPQYTRYNGRIGLEQSNGPWSVALSGTNLDDSEDLFSGIAGNGTNIRTPQPPREYMLTFNYRHQ